MIDNQDFITALDTTAKQIDWSALFARWVGRCYACKEGYVTTTTDGRAPTVKTCECGKAYGYIAWHQVAGTQDDSIKCTASCKKASKTAFCKCSCGGAQHGSGLRAI